MNSSASSGVPVSPAFGDSFGTLSFGRDHEKMFLLPIPTIVFWSKRNQNADRCPCGHDSDYGCFDCEICGTGNGPCSARRGQFIIEFYVWGRYVYVLIRNSSIPICKEKGKAETTARTYFMTNNRTSENYYRQHYTIKSLGSYIESCAYMKFPWLSYTDYYSDHRFGVIVALEKIADGMSATEAFGSLFKEVIAKNVGSRIIPPTRRLCKYVTDHCEKHFGEDGYKKDDYALGCLKPKCPNCYPWTGAQPSSSESGPIDIQPYDPRVISWLKAKAPYEVPPPAPVASSNSSASSASSASTKPVTPSAPVASSASTKPVTPSAPVTSSNSSASSASAKPVAPSASVVVVASNAISNTISNAVSSSASNAVSSSASNAVSSSASNAIYSSAPAPSRSSAVPVHVLEAISRLWKFSDPKGVRVDDQTFSYATERGGLDLTNRNLTNLLDGKLALHGIDFTKITRFCGVDEKDILLVLNHFQNPQRVKYVG